MDLESCSLFYSFLGALGAMFLFSFWPMEMETSCPHGSDAGKPVKIDTPHVHTESRGGGGGGGGIKEKNKILHAWILDSVCQKFNSGWLIHVCTFNTQSVYKEVLEEEPLNHLHLVFLTLCLRHASTNFLKHLPCQETGDSLIRFTCLSVEYCCSSACVMSWEEMLYPFLLVYVVITELTR